MSTTALTASKTAISRRRRRRLLLRKKLLLIQLLVLTRRKRQKRRWAVNPVWRQRDAEGYYTTLMKSLRQNDATFFQNFMRMSPRNFNDIEMLVHEDLKKYHLTQEPLTPAHRLAITLRYLATGESFISISNGFRVGHATVHSVVKETCNAIWRNLQPVYLPVPDEKMWKDSASGYNQIWQFPMCCGSVDGKHVLIQQPANSGSMYRNYKGSNSIILTAVVDPRYKFLAVGVGGCGSQAHDNIEKSLDTMAFGLPDNDCLPRSTIEVPHVLIGDEAFQLKTNFMTPYPQDGQCIAKHIFNNRLSHARLCSENAFGILVSRWKVFKAPMLLKPGNAELVVKACLALHNFLLTVEENVPNDQQVYCPSGYADFLDADRNIQRGRLWGDNNNKFPGGLQNMPPTIVGEFNSEAEAVRNAFASYFMSETEHMQ